MNTPKVYHCRTSKTGPTTPVTVRFSKYKSNGRLAVQLINAKAPWSVFATITVNLPILEDLMKMWFGSEMQYMDTLAFIDVNNCPWVEEFLQENHIAEPTSVIMPSGFCNYPLYQFNLDSIWEETSE